MLVYRPDATITYDADLVWNGTTVHSTVADQTDSTYWRTLVADVDRITEVSLPNVIPQIAGPISMHFRGMQEQSRADCNIDMYLMEGTTVRASYNVTPLATSWTEYSYTLNQTEINSITNWNDLRIRFDQDCIRKGDELLVSEVWFQTPATVYPTHTTLTVNEADTTPTWVNGKAVPIPAAAISINSYSTAPNYTVGRPIPVEKAIGPKLGSGSKIRKIALGGYHTIVLYENGEVHGWGYNASRQANPLSATTPWTDTSNVIFDDAIDISCGYAHTAVLRANGDLHVWGDNFYRNSNPLTTANPALDYDTVRLTGVKKVVCGYRNTFAIKENGDLHSWGINLTRQSDPNSSSNPVYDHTTVRMTNIRDVASTSYVHTWVIDEDDNAYSFGRNDYYQCGCSHNTNPATDYTTVRFTDVASVACGPTCTFVVRNNGDMHAWGYSSYYVLDHVNYNVALDYATVRHTNVKEMSAGPSEQFCQMLDKDGNMYSWGRNYDGQVKDPASTFEEDYDTVRLTGIESITQSGYWAGCVTTAGEVRLYGQNTYKQIEFSTTADQPDKSITRAVLGNYFAPYAWLHILDWKWAYPAAAQPVLTAQNVTVVGGVQEPVVRTPVGSLPTLTAYMPTVIDNRTVPAATITVTGYQPFIDLDLIQITSAAYFFWPPDGEWLRTGRICGYDDSTAAGTLVIDSKGGLHVWGHNSAKQLDVNAEAQAILYDENKTVRVKTKQIQSGNTASFAVGFDNNLYGWGSEWNAVLTNLQDDTAYNTDPYFVRLSGVDKISYSYGHCMALMLNGDMRVWGLNSNGQVVPNLWDSYPYYQARRHLVAMTGIKDISAGFLHSAVVKDNGDLICWGYNYYGQCDPTNPGGHLENMTTVSKTGVDKVSLGQMATYVLVGTNVYGWGANASGEITHDLGDGSPYLNTSTVIFTNARKVVGGYFNVAVIDLDDNLYIWGKNSTGQCNHTNTTDPALDYDTVRMTNVEDVWLWYHTVVLCKDGTIHVWGRNAYAESNHTNQTTPVYDEQTNRLTVGYLPTPEVVISPYDPNVVCYPPSRPISVVKNIPDVSLSAISAPSYSTLTVTGYSPSAAIYEPIDISVARAELITVTGYAPDLSRNFVLEPAAATPSLNTYSITYEIINNVDVEPAAADLNLIAQSLVVNITDRKWAFPAAELIYMTGYAPNPNVGFVMFYPVPAAATKARHELAHV